MVVLYKKVVVGFGFMVPDVKYNEAYISFLLVHPEWRRAGIGTFMIYHLIQVRLQRSDRLSICGTFQGYKLNARIVLQHVTLTFLKPECIVIKADWTLSFSLYCPIVRLSYEMENKHLLKHK